MVWLKLSSIAHLIGNIHTVSHSSFGKLWIESDEGNHATWIVQNRPVLRRHQRALWRLVLGLEIIADVFHLDPFDAVFGIEVLDQSGDGRGKKRTLVAVSHRRDARTGRDGYPKNMIDLTFRA